jgi:glycosyltransferase involved in cell wall biosynthesis
VRAAPSTNTGRRGASRRPLHVLLIVQEGGRDRLLNGLVDFTDASQVRYSAVTLARDPGPLWDHMQSRGVPVRSLGLNDITLQAVPPAAIRLRHVLRELRPDVAHSLLFYGSLATELARTSMRRPPPSLLVRHHNQILHVQGKRLHIRLDRWMAKRASRVVAVSHAVKSTLLQEGVPGNRVTVIHNGLDWDGAVRTDRATVGGWRARVAHRLLLVAAGRFTLQKDYPTLLGAFKLLREQRTDVHLVIAGTGSDRERAEMAALIDANEITDSVTLAGWVPDVYSLLAAADVFVHSALDEAFCQIVVEAGGLGIPVVSTSAGSVPEVLGEAHGPLPVRDPKALAEGLSRVLADLEGSKAKARALARDIRVRFTAAGMAHRYAETYTDLATELPDTAADHRATFSYR